MTFKSIGLVVALFLATFAGLNSNVHAFNIDESVEGFWYESNLNARRGWGFQYLRTSPETGVFFVAGYIYDDEGFPMWVTGQSTVRDGQFETDITLQLIGGGTFAPEQGDPVVIDDNVGNLNIVFKSCNRADFTFSGGEGPDFTQEFSHFREVIGGSREDNCVQQETFIGCPLGIEPGTKPRSCVLRGTYTSDLVLGNHALWQLDGVVYIGTPAAFGGGVPQSGPTLFIEAGTRIEGMVGPDALVISRGSKIIAQGQAHAPIVFSGPYTATQGAAPGDWGGLVINGAAAINNCDSVNPCENEGEGETGAYGGDDNEDDSGVLRYVRIQFAGGVIDDEQDDDLPGLSLLGVGSGTVIDHVQVHGIHDDGFKMQGGTVNARHLVASDVGSDSFDFSEGYTGKIQHALVWQVNDDTGSSDRGIETENNDDPDALPRTMPTMANVTMVGKMGEAAIDVSAGSGGRFSNFVISLFGDCIDIDDTATFAAAGTPASPSNVLLFHNVLSFCHVDYVYEAGDPWVTEDFVNAFPGNTRLLSPALDGFIPHDYADYLEDYPLDPDFYDDFFEDVDWMGAFRSRDSAWHYGWTEFLPQE
jgi:hypothetical protein